MAKTTRRHARASAVSGKAETEPRAVISSHDVFGIFKDGDISKLDVSQFQENPVVLFEHERGGSVLPVGKATSVEFVEGKGWVAEWEWFDGAMASEVRRAWEGGFLNATSVGLLWDSRLVENDEDGYALEVVEGSQQLAEFSVVALPLDAGALKLARASLKSEELLRTLAGATTTSREAKMPKDEYENKAAEDKNDEAMPDEEEKDDDSEAMEEEDKEMSDADGDADAEADGDAEAEAEAGAGEASGPVTEVAKLAVGLVAPNFDFASCTDRQIMIAALDGEVDEPAKLTTVKLEEAFASVVERRAKASAKLAKLARGNAKRAAEQAAAEKAEFTAASYPTAGADRIRTPEFEARRKAIMEASAKPFDNPLINQKEA